VPYGYYGGATDRISAALRMSALRVGGAQENISFLTVEKKETCAGISSAAKIFILRFEEKHFVIECFGLKYFIRKCNIEKYKRWAKTHALVSCTMYTFE
jgi:hypothetical protein